MASKIAKFFKKEGKAIGSAVKSAEKWVEKEEKDVSKFFAKRKAEKQARAKQAERQRRLNILAQRKSLAKEKRVLGKQARTLAEEQELQMQADELRRAKRELSREEFNRKYGDTIETAKIFGGGVWTGAKKVGGFLKEVYTGKPKQMEQTSAMEEAKLYEDYMGEPAPADYESKFHGAPPPLIQSKGQILGQIDAGAKKRLGIPTNSELLAQIDAEKQAESQARTTFMTHPSVKSNAQLLAELDAQARAREKLRRTQAYYGAKIKLERKLTQPKTGLKGLFGFGAGNGLVKSNKEILAELDARNFRQPKSSRVKTQPTGLGLGNIFGGSGKTYKIKSNKDILRELDRKKGIKSRGWF
jgi:hypothetical protein